MFQVNSATTVTRGKQPAELGPDAVSGPELMYKLHIPQGSETPVPGAKVVKQSGESPTQTTEAHSSATEVSSTAILPNISRIKVKLRAYAVIIAICRNPSFRAPCITPALLRETEVHLFEEAQGIG